MQQSRSIRKGSCRQAITVLVLFLFCAVPRHLSADDHALILPLPLLINGVYIADIDVRIEDSGELSASASQSLTLYKWLAILLSA
jgi:hypothetical protein